MIYEKCVCCNYKLNTLTDVPYQMTVGGAKKFEQRSRVYNAVRYNGVAVYYDMTIQLKLTKRKFKRKSQTHVSLILLVNHLLDSIILTLILESILFIPMQKQSLKYDNMLASCQLTTKLMIFTSRNYICVYFLIHVLWYQELEGITSDNHTKLY